MEPSFSEIQVLVDLGLTLKQARVYWALINSECLGTLEISKRSNVARSDVYAALEKLQQLGLTEKIIKTPSEYKATPINEGLSILLKMKTDQYDKIRAETEILRETAKREVTEQTNPKQKPQFVLVPAGRAVIEKIASSIENAKGTIRLVVCWKRFSRGIASTFAENMEKAWGRNVKIRFIVEKPAKNKTNTEIIRFFKEKPNSKIRFIRNHPNTIFGIYDRREVFIIVASKTDLQSSPALWSNNSALISLASDLFEALWFTSIEETDLGLHGL